MKKGITLGELAKITNGRIIGPENLIVTEVTPLDCHVPESISPLFEKKFLPDVKSGMILLAKTGLIPCDCFGVEVENTRRALIDVLAFFDSRVPECPGIHPAALVSPLACLGENVHIGPYCIVQDNAKIGDNCVLLGNVWVGRDVVLGDATRLEQGVVVHDGVSIGSRCIIHANAVIGSDGFGFIPDPKAGLLRTPQIGTVTIGNDVEIGTCTCIDKATFGKTVIGDGCKIDAQVKVGHNCRFGKYCIAVSQTGIAGSSILGDGVTLAAQSGVANHAKIGSGVTVGGRGGVVNDIAPGKTVSGFPAQEHMQELRERANLKHIPNIVKELKELKAKIALLEEVIEKR